MEEALRAKLLATAALTALVGTRVDWGVRSQGATLPAVVLHLSADVPTMNLDKPGAWSSARVAIDCWGRTHKAARDVANVIARPAGEGGLAGLRDVLSTIKFRTWVLGRDSDSDTDAQAVIHRTRLDLRVWYQL